MIKGALVAGLVGLALVPTLAFAQSPDPRIGIYQSLLGEREFELNQFQNVISNLHQQLGEAEKKADEAKTKEDKMKRLQSELDATKRKLQEMQMLCEKKAPAPAMSKPSAMSKPPVMPKPQK